LWADVDTQRGAFGFQSSGARCTVTALPRTSLGNMRRDAQTNPRDRVDLYLGMQRLASCANLLPGLFDMGLQPPTWVG
jgi:hypothetical protein